VSGRFAGLNFGDAEVALAVPEPALSILLYSNRHATFASRPPLRFGGGASFRSCPSDGRKSHRRAEQARKTKKYNTIVVKSWVDWKGWLDKNFPDASSSWPEAAAKAFAGVVGTEKWTYVEKGDIDRDGAPTGLLIRFKDAPLQDYWIVDRLIVTKWQDGKWSEMLRLGADDGLSINEVKPGAMQSPKFRGYHLILFGGNADNPEHPGIWTTVQAVDKGGNVLTEDANFFYVPAIKKYGGDSH
jgi:hypothetical protein